MTTAKFKIESGAQLLARLTKKIEIQNFYPILFDHGLKYGDVVEFNSDVNSSFLLIDLICEALYPSQNNAESTGVLLFNTVGNLVYEQLIITLKSKINKTLDINSNEQLRKAEVDRMLHRILSNFHLLEIYDATQFYTTIHNIDSILMKHSNISLLIFDTLTAFYWSEQGTKITKMDLYTKNLLRIIQNVSKEYKVVIVYTRPGYFTSSKSIDNLKTIEVSTDAVNVKVCNRIYSVNVKTFDSNYKKCFNIIDNLIKWQ